jgi:hypothetical protein
LAPVGAVTPQSGARFNRIYEFMDTHDLVEIIAVSLISHRLSSLERSVQPLSFGHLGPVPVDPQNQVIVVGHDGIGTDVDGEDIRQFPQPRSDPGFAMFIVPAGE